MPAAVLSLLVVLATATAVPPPPAGWVDDQNGFLSAAARSAVADRLEGEQLATGHQVVVWIGKTLDGAPLDDWAVRTFAAWKVGRKGFDDGIAMFVLADDRMVDIEVGYGLEDKVPDAIAARIIHDVMAPRLGSGDHDGAVTAGVDVLLVAIDGGSGSAAPAIAAHGMTSPDDGLSPLTWILIVLGGIAFVLFAVFHPRAALFLLWVFARGGRGGGSGGGFSGGGGSSGGGGARGGW